MVKLTNIGTTEIDEAVESTMSPSNIVPLVINPIKC